MDKYPFNFNNFSSNKNSNNSSLNFLKEYQVVIIADYLQKEIAEIINQFCRENKIGFIYTCIFGLAGFVFVDFGDMFITHDEDGEENKSFYVKHITRGKPGIVTIDDSVENKNMNLSYGDFVSFKEIIGMTELNDTPPRPIRIINTNSFSIEDTTKFSQYMSGGIVEQVKIPKPFFHRSLKENFDNIEQEEIGSSL